MNSFYHPIRHDGRAPSLETARGKLSAYIPHDLISPMWQGGGQRVSKSYSHKNFNLSFAEKVAFIECDFSDAAATGVIWRNNSFINCIFDRADFEFSDLSGSTFKGEDHDKNEPQSSRIVGAGFNAAVMRNIFFTNSTIISSSFSQTDFSGAVIQDSDISSGTFEGCIFHNARLSNLNLTNANIAYADFRKASLDKVAMSIIDLPFVFGIELDDIDNERLIIEGKGDNAEKPIRLDRAKIEAIKNDVAAHYNDLGAYFAGAAIYYLFDNQNRFVTQIEAGIKNAILREDYRILGHLCKLARRASDERNVFASSGLRSLYEVILMCVDRSPNKATQIQYNLHDGLIRSYLISNTKENSLIISFTASSPDQNIAHITLDKIITILIDGCALVGIAFDIIAISSTANSNPLIQITINNLNARTQININGNPRNTGDKNNAQDEDRSSINDTWSSHNIYTATIATISMLFAGASLLLNLINDGTLPIKLTRAQESKIEQHHNVINQLIIPESFVLREGVHKLAGSENGIIKIHHDTINGNSKINSIDI